MKKSIPKLFYGLLINELPHFFSDDDIAKKKVRKN
jgi:hypothetical protein